MTTTTPGTIRLSLDHDPYARVKKKLLDDASISFTSKGVMAYLLGKKDGWRLQVKDLVNRGTDGKHAIRTALNELRAAGYINYQPPRQIGSQGVWTIADSPIFARRTDLRDDGKRDAVNQHLSNNEDSNNEVSKSKETKETRDNPRSHLKGEIKATWKPNKRSKTEQLASLPVPSDYPSQVEFESWLDANAMEVASYRPDLYEQLCARKWNEWRNNGWRPIRNWQAYVLALDSKIEYAKSE